MEKELIKEKIVGDGPNNLKISKRSFFKGVLGAGLGMVANPTLAFDPKHVSDSDQLRICFGSCNLQFRDQSHWSTILRKRPDHYFFLGDNIYADTRDLDVMKKKYHQLGSNPHFSNFVENVSCEAIWDDHDFGEDGATREYPHKEESQKIFLDFFNIPETDPRHDQEGIYHTKEYSDGRIKVYFLDCRYFRDPDKGKKHTLLGEEQFQWLEDEFSKSRAQINIIVSPIGVLLNRFFVTEDWAEFPRDKERLFDLIARYNLSGTFFLSGDKHFGATIKRNWDRGGEKVKYYEFQSSGLTHTPGKAIQKAIKLLYGRKNVIVERNFATMDFDFSGDHPHMTWEIQSLESSKKLRRRLSLNNNGLWVMVE